MTGQLAAYLGPCTELITELRNIERAMLNFEIHHHRHGDDVQSDVQAIQTDVLEIEETSCFLEQDITLPDLPIPPWLEDGDEYVVTFPIYIGGEPNPRESELE